jgi:threonyl-tRNA synthetase
LTMPKKVREAEIEWIDYIIVVGQREVTSQSLPVRDRKTRKIRKLRLKDLTEEIAEKTKGKPFRPSTLPRRLSERPQFPS